jgi:transposase-like protein
MSAAQHLGVSGLADALGVSRHLVSKWRSRYGTDSAHPFPEPDVTVDELPGWAPARVAEVERWREGLPGRGAGGGRPPGLRSLGEYEPPVN